MVGGPASTARTVANAIACAWGRAEGGCADGQQRGGREGSSCARAALIGPSAVIETTVRGRYKRVGGEARRRSRGANRRMGVRRRRQRCESDGRGAGSGTGTGSGGRGMAGGRRRGRGRAGRVTVGATRRAASSRLQRTWTEGGRTSGAGATYSSRLDQRGDDVVRGEAPPPPSSSLPAHPRVPVACPASPPIPISGRDGSPPARCGRRRALVPLRATDVDGERRRRRPSVARQSRHLLPILSTQKAGRSPTGKACHLHTLSSTHSTSLSDSTPDQNAHSRIQRPASPAVNTEATLATAIARNLPRRSVMSALSPRLAHPSPHSFETSQPQSEGSSAYGNEAQRAPQRLARAGEIRGGAGRDEAVAPQRRVCDTFECEALPLRRRLSSFPLHERSRRFWRGRKGLEGGRPRSMPRRVHCIASLSQRRGNSGTRKDIRDKCPDGQ
ncbi:hypothetical protein FA95DRAFT_153744 [Auriscalpium vulgare]|uniref:Uncharacterized protein n=1 Tax=Auriscalpium vulgare TaxID=40419 RepID=A0ACB8RMA5_9AGAM|nr:hypothetical protein FA95DRAFT_153744 [Auriscalpium vulgare]